MKATPALPPERPKLLSNERPKLLSNILPKIPTPDMRTATLQARLVNAGVPADPDFINGLLRQLITAGDMGGQHDDHEIGFLFSVIEGTAPRDIVDAMSGSQLGMLQGTIVRQVRLVKDTIDPVVMESRVNTLAKLIRTFTALSDALTRRRNGGSPSVSVGHMSISDHAQAIVGNMTQIQGEAAPDEAAPSPPLPVDAKAVPITDGLLGQLITAGDMADRRDDRETGFLFSVMEGVAPRDVTDAMIGSHLGMLQGLIARQMRLVNRTADPVVLEIRVNTLGKLIRTFTALVEALRRRRNGGNPSVSVGHMSISDHAQAIVGNTTQIQGEAASDEAAPSTAAPRRRKGGPNAKP